MDHYSPLRDADKYRAPYTIPLNDRHDDDDRDDEHCDMATTTPAQPPPSRPRNSSHSRTRSGNLPSRPTTPLRPPSRTSLRASQTTPSGNPASLSASNFPLANLEPAFAELSDSMADLEANFMHLQLLNESIARFNENFGAFLYGMNMSAFCVDFPEVPHPPHDPTVHPPPTDRHLSPPQAPIPQSFARHKDSTAPSSFPESPFPSRVSAGMMPGRKQDPAAEVDATFLTTDTSFVENPPTSSKPASKYSAPPASASAASERKSVASGRGTAGARGRGTAGSTRGARGSAGAGRSGSGVGRGSARGRGTFR